MFNHLEFADGRNFRVLGNLCELNVRKITIQPGAYVLIAEGEQFQYLEGRSPVFYIGKAVRLRQRLKGHRRKIEEASDKNRKHQIYRPVTEYAAKHGATVAIFPTDGLMSERELEFQLLAEFMASFRGLPVANNAVNWRKVREYLKKLKNLNSGE